ncbi:hypothetical protein NIES267_54890 [Calothrix parasitica NIES-267]|uniref:CopG domain protein DNA-binding domain protein n=1 Tax=Calothrix parasitica NIES-267 TaxID=1973488 RepID=A0A1Z4LXM3_9CYAN|nr:hypothetical protein NIES267_54890 [Calothrix parasitica NIES-267]
MINKSFFTVLNPQTLIMRIRVDIWVSLRCKLKEEAAKTGLSVSEIVNTVVADYFKMLPKSDKSN